MPNLLHIQSSPRGDESFSIRVARAFLAAYRRRHGDAEIDTLDLFTADIPVFAAPHAEAKYAVLSGAEPRDEAGREWKRVMDAVERFKSAGLVVISAPMWNFSIPHRLKGYIDVIVQPGLTFSYTPEAGNSGLVTGRPAVLILARGGDYSPAGGSEHLDMQRPYLEAILKFMGFTDVRCIVVEPTAAGGPEMARRKLNDALAEAEDLAAKLLRPPLRRKLLSPAPARHSQADKRSPTPTTVPISPPQPAVH